MNAGAQSVQEALLSSAFGFILLDEWPKLSFAQSEDQMMYRALQLASLGVGRTHPNPPVGSVIAKSGLIIAEAYHEKAGLAHAEAKALQMAGEAARDAEISITLEPCTHFGKTPPCVGKVLASGVSKVRIGALDPNPNVNGKGLGRLLNAQVDVKVCEDAFLQRLSESLVAPFAVSMTRHRPYVVLKMASSLDGRVAQSLGVQTPITGSASGRLVHRLRDKCDAVAVGRLTVEVDNPRLTVRDVKRSDERQPLRVVFDSALALSKTSRVFATSDCVVVHDGAAAESEQKAFDASGIRRIAVAGANGRLSLEETLAYLAQTGLTSVLVEGGPQLWTSFINAGLVDEIWWFSAPSILGAQGLPAIEMLSSQAQNWLTDSAHSTFSLPVGRDQLTIIRIQKPL